MNKKSQEHLRLNALKEDDISTWRKWGPYVSERSWGTVREDYSADGDAWNFLSHDMARSKAYRWGEDGLAGICDYYQTMVFSLALWNGKDPILKERLFGLTPYEGNHGEDVKECYYYLDATPTHSYLKYLYKYPQDPYPYDTLVEKNKQRGTHDREFEIYDTSLFEAGRYFDVYVEYAKADIQDICIKIEVVNRSHLPASISLIPQIWYRNQWSWKEHLGVVPEISLESDRNGITCLYADSNQLPQPAKIVSGYPVPSMYLHGSKPNEILFTDNETNNEKLYGQNVKNRTGYTKDAFHRYIINNENATNPEKKGTKACFYYKNVEIQGGSSKVFYFRLTDKKVKDPLDDIEKIIDKRKNEADEFYDSIQSKNIPIEDRKIQRAALSGMIWSKQFYYYNISKWLSGDNPNFPPPPGRGDIRNGRWKHIYALDVFSMPDKWEYPWFAAWDLAFHSLTFSLVDMAFAKNQIRILLTHMYQRSNGQIPAYEWGFSDLNPPVQALALYRIYLHEINETGKGDTYFLHWGFLKIIRNFDWWLNRVDKMGNNLFEGGFLGLDNISIIDRSEKLGDGGVIQQSDATGWMGLYAIVLMRISLELAKEMPVYEGLATVFFEQFVYIASTMHDKNKMWDHEDGFFYDIVLYPDGRIERLKIRSFVGIIPFYSLFSMEEQELSRFEKFYERIKDFENHNKEIVSRCLTRVDLHGKTNFLFTMMNIEQIKRVLSKAFDPEEFLSDYGLRSVSKYHQKHPLYFQGRSVTYEPGESLEKIKGGNSNWRGPIWLPTNFLFVDSLVKLSKCMGEDYPIPMVDGSSKTLAELKHMLRERLVSIFRKNSHGQRPVHGDVSIYSQNKEWEELLLFYEHYHGDTGRGLGASHQTGWSGLVANMIYLLYPNDTSG
ncbi:MAG: glucosidase [Chlamydiae bacterium]|nr:glucosidase [Chlamydiota bacterium]